MYLPKPSEGGNFTPPPAGTFPAVCYRIIDLGTQSTTFQGETKLQHKVLLSWELHDEDARMTDGQPMTAHQRYTWSMHEKANLRKQLEAWRGKKFADGDFGPGGFSMRKLLGVPCMLNIIHTEKDGKTYANIASVSKMPRGMQSGDLINTPLLLSLDPSEFDAEAFHALPDGIQATIQKSPEWHELQRKGSGAETMASKLDDEVPF